MKVITVSAMIAALYVAVNTALAPISFLAAQVRIAEALTLLCVFSPMVIPGITLGCAISNAIGIAMGASILGPLDIVLGSLATLVAGILSYLFRNIRIANLPVLSALPPILLNALVIGGELTFATTGGMPMTVFWPMALGVGWGQLLACGVCGLLLVYLLEKTGAAKSLFGAKK